MDFVDGEEDLFRFSQDTLGSEYEEVSDEEVILDEGPDPAPSVWPRSKNALHAEADLTDRPDVMLLEEDVQQLESTQHRTLERLDSQTTLERDRTWVKQRIEEMVEMILDGLLDDSQELCITLKTRSGLSRRDIHEKHGNVSLPAKLIEVTFPGTTANEAWRFTVLLRILEIVHHCLVENVILSKRDLYYRDPELFVRQSTVDRYVDDLACTLGVPRSSLNITAAAKGLVAGNFVIMRAGGHSVNGLSDNEGLLMPRIQEDDCLVLSNVQHIVVIEKEATFRSLMSSHSWHRLKSQLLVLTAKGYPDIASRKFLRALADHAPYIPMHILVDFDPDGINIMSTYKHGSYRLAHEDGADRGSPAINLPQLHWLGVKSQQLSPTPAVGCDPSDGAPTGDSGLIRMTARDRRKACLMLEWDVIEEPGPEKDWRHELQAMLMLNIKAEMQVLEERPGGLGSWLAEALEEYERTLSSGRLETSTGDAGSDGVLDLL